MDYANDPRYQKILGTFKEAGLTGHPRFYELLAEEACTHADKNHDYAGTADPLANLKECVVYGIDPIDGVITRITDKDMRFRNWYKQWRAPVVEKVQVGVLNSLQVLPPPRPLLAVADETAPQTLLDRSVYTKLLRILIEERMARA